MLINDLNQSIDFWIAALDQYKDTALTLQPNADSWSVGQLYMHLLEDTRYYMEQVASCLSTDTHATEAMSPLVEPWFANNSFPNERLKGAPDNARIPQPAGKQPLAADLQKLKQRINALHASAVQSPFKGKARHPGFGYFNAAEWLQFADMHFRHHIRQKQQIDAYLTTTGS